MLEVTEGGFDGNACSWIGGIGILILGSFTKTLVGGTETLSCPGPKTNGAFETGTGTSLEKTEAGPV